MVKVLILFSDQKQNQQRNEGEQEKAILDQDFFLSAGHALNLLSYRIYLKIRFIYCFFRGTNPVFSTIFCPSLLKTNLINPAVSPFGTPAVTM